MVCMPSIMYTKVSLLQIPSLLTKPFTKDIFNFIYFLFNPKIQIKDTSRHGDDGQGLDSFSLLLTSTHSYLWLHSNHCYILLLFHHSLKPKLHQHKIKVVESSLHFMKHEKIMRRDWNHKEPPEIRWAKSFLKIKKNAYYTEKDWGKEEEGWVILYKNIFYFNSSISIFTQRCTTQ